MSEVEVQGYRNFTEFKEKFFKPKLLAVLENSSILATDPEKKFTLSEITKHFLENDLDREFLDMYHFWDFNRRKNKPQLKELSCRNKWKQRLLFSISEVLREANYGSPKIAKNGTIARVGRNRTVCSVYSLKNNNSNSNKSQTNFNVEIEEYKENKNSMSNDELFLAYISALKSEANRRGLNFE